MLTDSLVVLGRSLIRYSVSICIYDCVCGFLDWNFPRVRFAPLICVPQLYTSPPSTSRHCFPSRRAAQPLLQPKPFSFLLRLISPQVQEHCLPFLDSLSSLKLAWLFLSGISLVLHPTPFLHSGFALATHARGFPSRFICPWARSSFLHPVNYNILCGKH
jgi:hypothetical protein